MAMQCKTKDITFNAHMASLITQLEELAYKLGIDIRYEDFALNDYEIKGGLCRLKNKKFIFVNQRQPLEEQARTIARALKTFDLESVYMRPALRIFIFQNS